MGLNLRYSTSVSIGTPILKKLSKLLPKGPKDALFQLSLFVAADLAYETIRGIVEGRAQIAFANARVIVEMERSMGLFFEKSFQASLINTGWIIEVANWTYMNSHLVVTTAFLVWLYIAHNDSFYFVRNMFLVAMGLALVGYLLVPTAPPRMLASLGFIDTIAEVSSIKTDSSVVRTFINPYAAIPSMHMAFALMISIPAVVLVKRMAFKVLWALYPLVVMFTIIVTANHFWLDAAAGALVAVAAAVAAYRLSKARPSNWAWNGAKAQRATASA